MYFKEKGNTNIDSEFKKRNNLDLSKLKLPLIIASGVILLLIIIIVIITSTKKENINYFIELIGDSEITIYKGNDYIEPGYNAYDNKQNNLFNEVDIKSTLDINNIGNYEIVYSLGNTSVTRKISVIEKPKGATYIYLKGDSAVYLDTNEKYIEPGYIVIDTLDSNLTDKVKVTSNIDNSKSGTYKIIYSVINSSGVTTSAARTVIVMGSEISLSLNTEEYTNSTVTINAFIKDNYFDYMILPNGEKVDKNNYSYQVSSNGTYKFISVNKKGTKKEASITISNIDKEKPTGSCSGTYKDGKSSVKVSANDNVGINKYVINGNSYTSSSITLNSEVKSVKVTIYDKAGNSNLISCNLENKNNIILKYSYETNKSSMPYALYTPTGVDNTGKKIPLIVWLHGIGEYGKSESAFKSSGLLNVLNKWKFEGFNAYVLCPHITGRAWKESWPASKNNFYTLLDYIVSQYNIDKKKIIIVGYSSGGIGALTMVVNRPDYFSSMVILSASESKSGNVNKISPSKIAVKGYVGNQDDSGCYYYMTNTFKNRFGSSNLKIVSSTHGNLPWVVFNLDEDKNGKSDVVEWMLKQELK